MRKNEEFIIYVNYFNLTQEDMSIVLGVSAPCVSLWLSGKREVPAIYTRVLKYFYQNKLDIKELLK